MHTEEETGAFRLFPWVRHEDTFPSKHVVVNSIKIAPGITKNYSEMNNYEQYTVHENIQIKLLHFSTGSGG
jgi:hypothetical protein